MKVDMDAFDEILNKLPSDIGGSTADIYIGILLVVR